MLRFVRAIVDVHCKEFMNQCAALVCTDWSSWYQLGSEFREGHSGAALP